MEETTEKKTTSRKYVLVCWFMVLTTLVVLSHFVCMVMGRAYPLTEIIGILGLNVTVIITYVTGNVYQKSHIPPKLDDDEPETEAAPI